MAYSWKGTLQLLTFTTWGLKQLILFSALLTFISLSLSLSPFGNCIETGQLEGHSVEPYHWWLPFSRWTWVSRCLLKQRMTEVVVTTGLLSEATSRAKLQWNHHHQQTNNSSNFTVLHSITRITGRIPFLSPNQQCQRWVLLNRQNVAICIYINIWCINN